MSSAVYAIGIFTLALWLSVVGIGGTGMVLTGKFGLPLPKEKPKEPFSDLNAIFFTDTFTGPEEISQETTDTGALNDTPEEALPEPPQIPETENSEPLPELPELPSPSKQPAFPSKPAVSPRGSSSQGNPAARNSAGNGGAGMSDARRLSGGRMPAPSYPAEARRKGQSGTVIVEFIVGENGSVITAYAKRASPWPLLNEAAVRSVRRWKFPASGKTSKYTRPITFQLN